MSPSFDDNEDQHQSEDTTSNNNPDSVVDQHPTAAYSIPDHHTFLQAAISIKNQVTEVTWKEKVKGDDDDEKVEMEMNPTLYTGVLGTAFTCLRSHQTTGCHQDLLLAADIVRACASSPPHWSQVTFLSGRGGIYALGAVIMNYMEDRPSCKHFLDKFIEVAQEKALPVGPEDGGLGMSYDLQDGRAGFLWAALFIKKHLGEEALSDDLLTPVVKAVLAAGRVGSYNLPLCPLMYTWQGIRYLGAQHGLAGILHVLLHFPLKQVDAEDVKQSLRYLMSIRFPSGNYPSYDGDYRDRDNLVQWCHGTTAIAITLCKASQVFPNEQDFRDGAIAAGEVLWNHGLVEKVGLADGVAGNAYAFLSLYKLTGEAVYVERAQAFASYLFHKRSELVKPDYIASTVLMDRAYSLFEGLAGVACFFFDLLHPEKSKFPGFEL